MMLLKLSGIIFGLAVLFIVGIDILLATMHGIKATISWWIYSKSKDYPILAAAIGFVFGLLMGHLFWQMGC